MAAHKRGPRFKDPDEPRRKNSRVSVLDRVRIVDVYSRGGDVKQLEEDLGINIKTSRSIAATDRQTSLRGGGSKKKFGDDAVSTLRRIVDKNCTFTLRQIKAALEEEMPAVMISTSTVDRLLDAHSYSVKLVTQRPADRYRDNVKHSRKLYAQWLQFDGPRVCRFYLDETSYNIWCSRNFGRAAKGQPAVHTTTTTKGANLNIMASMFRPVWKARNQTQKPCSFLMAHLLMLGEQAALANSMHTIKRLPAYSPFFNPTKVFSKFKSHVKAYLSERPDLVLATAQGMTKKEHRRSLLLDAARHSMQQIQRVDCAAFDGHNFSFVPAALREDDL
ncbi:hypothetical protein HPB52_013669 [Rhipicephalus sanguineus]|uniref:Tc1-like transposase DDE domain-containing protein n=1 Tax=Rhipicephalus sanguineus TaxID=34632 RepID=A0A9D4SP73_RHISA|nr:hypothetical protein HPB52_013669 [Rhipicephalus sanguineus]